MVKYCCKNAAIFFVFESKKTGVKMKSILYFILAVLTIVYIGFLCYVNIAGDFTGVLKYISVYGGLIIALLYAAINFFGNPLKIVFFILLILAVIVLILTIVIPDTFRDLFGISESAQDYINLLR